ncbi:MAG: hypothetical protein P8Q97_09320 [Myxococcota bacterium]|nr:hypothetical protein [Myxococcota bacterium]
MTGRWMLWIVPLVLYIGFSAWYTDLGGQLRPGEIAVFSEALEENGLAPERVERIRRFMESDRGRQFFMVNAIDMNEDPPDVEGARPGASAEELMGRYMEHMYAELFRRASHPALYGDAVFSAIDLVGIEGAEEWDAAALFRYRSRRTFMEIISNPATLGRHEFKIAALDKTIAYPIEMPLYLGDPRLVLGLLMLSLTALVDIALYGRRGGSRN